jgi:hypothetical protein
MLAPILGGREVILTFWLTIGSTLLASGLLAACTLRGVVHFRTKQTPARDFAVFLLFWLYGAAGLLGPILCIVVAAQIVSLP